MADESAELVGGIEVEVGATHAKLISDLEAANRLLAQWQAQVVEVTLGARLASPGAQVAAQPARAQVPLRPTAPPPIRYGASATTGAQAGQGQTALQRAINAELAKTGEIWDANNNEAVSATKAVRQQREAVGQLQQTASAGVGLSLDPDFQPQLETALRTLREIVAEATKLASIGATVDIPAQQPAEPVHPTPAPVSRPAAQPRTATATPAAVRAAPQAAVPVVQAVPEVRAQEAVPVARARRVAREEQRALPAPVEAAQPERIEPVVEQPARAARSRRAPERIVQPARAVEESEEAVPTPAVAGGGGGRRRPPPVAAPGGEEPEQEGEYGPPIQYPTLKGPGYRGFKPVISPQQRAAERQARDRAAQDEATVRHNAAQAAQGERQAREAILSTPPPGGYDETPQSATVAPRRRPVNEDEQHARQQRQAPPRPVDRAAADRQRAEDAARLRSIPPVQPYRLPDQRATAGTAGLGTVYRRQSDADIERQTAERLAVREAQAISAGRTAHTAASSFGSFAVGGARERIRAEADLSAATQRRKRDERDVSEAERFARRPEVVADLNRRKDALADVNTAQERYTKSLAAEEQARKKVESFSSAGSGARNLLAVTAAGAAFGAGLSAISVVLRAVTPALGEYIDIQTGFGATSTKVTSALAQQTLALKGNAASALAAAEAQAGLSTSGSDAVTQQLLLTTQIKAGAQAQQQASELFKAGAGQGNAPTGLFGGYGGVGGTSLLAEQLGGGRGFTESLLKDIQGLRGQQGPDLLGNLNLGFSYLTSPGVRSTVGQSSKDQGNLFGQGVDTLSRIPGGIADKLADLNPFGKGYLQNQADRVAAAKAPSTAPTAEQQSYVTDQNTAAQRGATRLGDTSTATLAFTQDANEIAAATRAAAQAGDQYGATLAQQEHLVLRLNGAVVQSGDDYARAASQFAVGRGIQDPGQLSRLAVANEQQRQIESAASADALKSQFAFERPATLNRLQREQDFALQTQLPAQNALQNLAAPPTPVGTGITGRNAAEQGKINSALKTTTDLQSTLNSEYAQGFNILRDTYQIPVNLLTSIQSLGNQIASTQAGIANEQSKYQVAQFNFQLMIARRTLTDINGLTGRSFGGQGQSYLGQLERENLALGRQGQLLQFALSQRQLNFQRAVAGFTVPGLTPAEQNARVEEARVTTSFAQKQLDIQKQMFGNQVQIVDIGNLRQGYDLAKQVSLLLTGRQVTIDTAVAQQKLARLEAQQQILVQQAGTYITKVNAQVAGAMSEMEALEKATGTAISQTEKQGIAAAYNVGRAFFMGITGGGLLDNAPKPPGTPKTQENLGGSSSGLHASGGVFNTKGATSLGAFGVAGEAGGETVAILAHPRALAGDSGGNGGGNVYVTFGDVQIRTEADFQRLYRMVLDALGRDAATRGLRTPF